MAFFLSYFSTRLPIPDETIFEDALPFNPKFVPPKVDTFYGENNRLFVWSYTPEIDRPILRRNKDALWTEGYAPERQISLEDRLVELLQSKREDNCGSFCGVWHRLQSVLCYTSLAGNCSLFVYKTDTFTAISNRINLLASLGSLTIRDGWLLYLAGPRRALDFGTSFKEIITTKPGEIICIRPEGVTCIPPKLKQLFQPMDVTETLSKLYAFPEYFGSCLSQVEKTPFTLTLSGGRDSRTVLSMLDILGIMDMPNKVCAETLNLKHDAEFLSAQRQLDLFDFEVPHHSTNSHFIKKDLVYSIVYTIFRRGFGIDLAQLGDKERIDPTIKPKGSIFLGGTDYNLKIWFPTMPLHKYLRWNKYTLYGSALISPEAQKKNLRNNHILMTQLLSELPQEYYLQLESWWIALSRAYSCHLERGLSLMIWPFIDTAFWRFFLSAPIEFFTTQAAYYLLMRKAQRPLWKVPFCDLDWPLSLPRFLYKHGLPVDNLDTIPYRFDPNLPGETESGRIERLDALINMTQGYIRDKVKQHKELFSFVSQEGLNELTLQPAEKMKFIHGCCGSGLLCGILLAEYGQKLLQRSQLQDIQDDLTDILRGPRGIIPSVELDKEVLHDRVIKYEERLSHTAQQLAVIRSKCRYEWLKDYPELLGKMGFININNGYQVGSFNVEGMKSFKLQLVILGPSISYHRPSRIPINPPIFFVKPDIETTFIDLRKIGTVWGTIGQLQDGTIVPWNICFNLPDGVKRITCFFTVIENSMPIFISDIIAQSQDIYIYKLKLFIIFSCYYFYYYIVNNYKKLLY